MPKPTIEKSDLAIIRRTIAATEELQLALLDARKAGVMPICTEIYMCDLDGYLTDLLGDLDPIRDSLQEAADIESAIEAYGSVAVGMGGAS